MVVYLLRLGSDGYKEASFLYTGYHIARTQPAYQRPNSYASLVAITWCLRYTRIYIEYLSRRY